MDWSKTKTIFIVVFLVLNMFLLYQYIQKRSSNGLEVIAESTIEDKLKENEITYKTLPKQPNKEQYLSAKSKLFSDEELKKLKNQRVQKEKNQQIYASEFKPLQLGEKIHSEALDSFVKENVLHGDQYRFWKVDEIGNVIIYYQTYKGKMIFNNSSAKLELKMDDKRQVISYTQTYLDDIDEQFNEKDDVIPAIKAIETLFNKGSIQPNNEITNVELGYINILQDTASHILTPIWHVEINNEDDFFVNALDGRIIEFNDGVNISDESDMDDKKLILE
ncbi:two-component system regulatory protein YycI [Bacillus massiliigorillae]|uniref:two-component system regulatory protein YycI n=1 Tax=Bacillus massiliigorillae TaxID=1243664 RepID=UPI00039DC618|nr:two-component system regulatory protein YycI [Bacillus massiliigorillae]